MRGYLEIFARFTFNHEWDVAELPFAKFCAQVARKNSDLIGLPPRWICYPAAKAGMSEHSARRMESDGSLPSQHVRRYWRSRPNPFAASFCFFGA